MDYSMCLWYGGSAVVQQEAGRPGAGVEAVPQSVEVQVGAVLQSYLQSRRVAEGRVETREGRWRAGCLSSFWAD